MGWVWVDREGGGGDTTIHKVGLLKNSRPISPHCRITNTRTILIPSWVPKSDGYTNLCYPYSDSTSPLSVHISQYVFSVFRFYFHMNGFSVDLALSALDRMIKTNDITN